MNETPAFPARALAFGVLLTIALFAGGSLVVWRLYAASQHLATTEIRLGQLTGAIVHLDEVLTMSARMTAATGDRQWEARYRRFEPQLDAAIKEAIGIAPEAASGSSAAATDQANARLVAMENRAFDLVRQGDREAAAAVLFSPEYERQKGVYAAGMEASIVAMRQRVTDQLGAFRRRALLALMGGAVVLALLALCWARVVGVMRRYLAQLADLNRTLEDRVRRRTAELDAANQHLQESLRRLKETQEQLIHAGRMAAVGTLVAGISHELNNPICVIQGYAQSLLKSSSADDPRGAALRGIERQSQRSAKLVQMLLDFSRRKPSARERIAPAAILQRVRELVATQARNREVAFEVRLFEEGLPDLFVCVTEVESSLLNVINNALDATGAGGSVTVECRAARGEAKGKDDAGGGAGVELVVRDTGGGIPPEVLSQIFDPFFTTKAPGKGTGLGLSLARQMMEANRGRIEAESKPGEGTTMRLHLPAAPAVAAAAPAPLDAPGPAAGTVAHREISA